MVTVFLRRPVSESFVCVDVTDRISAMVGRNMAGDAGAGSNNVGVVVMAWLMSLSAMRL